MFQVLAIHLHSVDLQPMDLAVSRTNRGHNDAVQKLLTSARTLDSPGNYTPGYVRFGVQ